MPTRRKTNHKSRRRVTRKESGIPRTLLASIVQGQIERFGLSRNDAAVVVNDAASQVSRMMTGHVYEFSSDRMVDWLTRLGSDVTIQVKLSRRLGRRGKVRVQKGRGGR